MKIVIDIGHPAHVHLFKNFAWKMIESGHLIYFTIRDKEFEIQLLQTFNFSFKILGKHHKTKKGKILGLLTFTLKLFIHSKKIKPDLFLSHGSMYAAITSWLLRRPHISFEDTFNFEQIRLYKPFTKYILTADYDHPIVSPKVISYAGYHELAYLHPNEFKPNPNVLKDLGIKENEHFSIIRFVSWNASHDIGHYGISLQNKMALLEVLKEFGKVFISSEAALPSELAKHSFPLTSDKMHDAMAFASLVYGESGTMAAEAAVLGTPAIYLDNTGRIYTRELEKKYNLVFNFTESESDQLASIKKAKEILENYNPNIWKLKKNVLLNEKINVSNFLVWFICKYPHSVDILKKDPDFQKSFIESND